MIPEVEERITSLKTKIKSLKSEIEQTEKELIKAYEDRFPIGKFHLVRINHWNRNVEERKTSYEMYWQKDRKSLGMTTVKSNYHNQVEVIGYPGLYHVKSYGRPHGKTTQYESLEKMLLAAQKFRFPINLIEAFVTTYAAIKEKENAGQAKNN